MVGDSEMWAVRDHEEKEWRSTTSGEEEVVTGEPPEIPLGSNSEVPRTGVEWAEAPTCLLASVSSEDGVSYLPPQGHSVESGERRRGGPLD